jgi:transcriptional regulator with XRE-family HTH domain
MPRTRTKGALKAPPPTPGEIVRRRRKELNLSQATVADMLGVAQPTISGFERDQPSQLSSGNLLLLALRLGLNPLTLDPSLAGVYEGGQCPCCGRALDGA